MYFVDARYSPMSLLRPERLGGLDGPRSAGLLGLAPRVEDQLHQRPPVPLPIDRDPAVLRDLPELLDREFREARRHRERLRQRLLGLARQDLCVRLGLELPDLLEGRLVL